jgi:microcystin-dependent protein
MTEMRSSILGAIVLFAIAAPSASAATVSSIPRDASVLFALEAAGGSFERMPGKADRYTLTLRGVARGTTWFSDRPRREAGRIVTRSLLRSWRRLGFAAEPPNAAVVLDKGRRARDTVALELRLLGRSDRRRTARFKVRVLQGLGPGLSRLHGRLDRRLPKRFSRASLFIDDATSAPCTIGQPRLFGFSRAAEEDSYLPADGSMLDAREYPELFQYYGTQFGGDGKPGFRAPDLQPPLGGMSWQVCADGASPNFRRMPQCPTGELVLWSLGDTPVSAVDQEHWLPADGRTVATADYPTFADLYLDAAPPETFALPNLVAPPGFVYLACVYGDDDTNPYGMGGDPVGEGWSNYLAQVDLFIPDGAPLDRRPGGFALGVASNQALFQLLGTTFGGNGVNFFETPNVPSPVAGFSYFTAASGLFPSW